MKVAIQGGKASFHDIASRIHFGEDVNTIECDTFRKLCETLKNDKSVDFALMAIENSIAGSILPNYSLLKEYDFAIIGEVQLRIKMNLIGHKDAKLSELNKVMSHYMALLQCEDFLYKHPAIEKEEYYDTADAVKYVKESGNRKWSAIASRYAANYYGMELLAEGIETVQQNFTRFFVLSREKKHKVEGATKATLSFQLPNKVGALAEVLKIIVDNKINLTKIQSLPIIGKPNEYTFYVDCEWSNYDDFKRSVGINSIVTDLKILGEYKKGEMIDDYTGGQPS
ncbi:MAG: pheA [Cytophagaceae bacterium]|jgi:prephenate dehydratase|nr:pheA [Cytophagaceae bacterium]